MRFTLLLAVSLVATVLLALAPMSSPPRIGIRAAAGTPANARFLFDLGDGTYYWAAESIPNPSGRNATWNSTLAAARSLGLAVSWSWSSQFGEAFILDIGNRSPPAGAVGIFIWNRTAHAWDPAPAGINDLVLSDNDSIALSDNAFDQVTYDYIYPVPTPDHPYPTLGFRGDAANSGRSLSPSPDGLRVMWDRSLGIQEIPSSPVVAYGRVYSLTLDGLFAIDETNGSVVWTNPRITGLSTAAVFNGTLILGGADGKVHAVDAGTGAERWNRTLVAHPVFSGITSSPKVVFETVYVGTFNESGGPGEVVALWATNGTVIWRHPTASIDFSSPAVANGSVYVGIMGLYNTTTQVTFDSPYGVLALDSATGVQRWFYETNGSVAASPLLTGAEVIAASKDGYVYALNATTGQLLWKTAANATASSPTLDNDSIFVPGGNAVQGMITQLDAVSGAFRKLVATDAGPTGESSVTYSQGKILFATNVASGGIYCWQVPDLFDVWFYHPSPAQYILSTPVAADGMVFGASDNGHVYAFGEPTSLVNLTVNAPANLTLGQEASIAITGWTNGSVRDFWVNFTSDSLEVRISSNPQSSGPLGWNLGTQPFSGAYVLALTVRAACQDSCPGGLATFTIRFAERGVNGNVLVPPLWSGSIHIVSSPPGGFPWLIAGGIGTAAVAAVAIALYLVHRRRHPRAP